MCSENRKDQEEAPDKIRFLFKRKILVLPMPQAKSEQGRQLPDPVEEDLQVCPLLENSLICSISFSPLPMEIVNNVFFPNLTVQC